MHYFIRRKHPFDAEFKRISQELIAHADAGLTRPHPDIDRAVHEARKSMKKLRALLRLTRPALEKKVFRSRDREIKDFSNQLSAARDSAILIDTLTGLLDGFQPWIKPSVTESVHRELKKDYQAALGVHLSDLQTGSLQQQLEALRGSLEDWDFSSIRTQDMPGSIEKVYRDGRRAWKRARAEPTAAALHDFRKQVKHLYYQMRLLQQWKVAAKIDPAGRFEKLGELLGQEHDLAVLQQALKERPQLCVDAKQSLLLSCLAGGRRQALLEKITPNANEAYARPWKELGIALTS